MAYYNLFATILTLSYALAQDADCDFRQYVRANQKFFIYNSGNPLYRPGSICRYIATCPAGYNCRVDCVLNMPLSSQCSLDRFLVSRYGDPQLISAQVYCGRTAFTAVSINTTLSLGLVSSRSSPGGQYACNVTTQLTQPPPTPPPAACRCGERKSVKIVGGTTANEDEFPMMAAIIERSIDELYCGGVIIAPRYILTAAHCIYSAKPSQFEVMVGSRDITAGKRFAIQSYKPHPKFNGNNFDYDIGLVSLRTSVPYSSSILPACLPFKYVNRNLTSARVTMIGWGTLFSGGPKPSLLRKVDVSVTNRTACPAATDRQFCTYGDGKDACQNDSGGPVLYTDPTTGLLFNVGVVSNGVACASDSPGYNTNVAALLQWVLDNANSTFCIKQ